MELEQGDVILCTVDRIIGTTVFLKIEDTNKEASMTFSEVSPGRIRNIRDFVVPKKTIVCKILKIQGDLIEVSLRRVTPKETKEVMEQHNFEKSYKAIIKSVLKEKSQETIDKIKEKSKIYEFLEDAKENPSQLKKIVGEENAQKILEILKIQKKKTVIVKKEIHFSTNKSNGIEIIKRILKHEDQIQSKYIAAGKYSIMSEEETAKKAGQKINEIIAEVEKKAKAEGIEIQIK